MKHWEHLCLLWDAVSWEGRSCQDIFMVSLSSFNDVGNDWRLRLQLVLQAKQLASVKEELLTETTRRKRTQLQGETRGKNRYSLNKTVKLAFK